MQLFQRLVVERVAPFRTRDGQARDRTVGTTDISRPPTSTGYGYGLGQWIDPSSPLIVSSPGAFGFTPWVDRTTQVAGILLVKDNNQRLFADINAIRAMVNVVVANGMGYRPAPVLPSQRVTTTGKAPTASATTAQTSPQTRKTRSARAAR